MTAVLVDTITSHRKTRLPGQGGQKVKQAFLIRLTHLGAVFSCKRTPALFVIGRLPEFEQLFARCQFGQPDVIKIPGCKLDLRNTAWPLKRRGGVP